MKLFTYISRDATEEEALDVMQDANHAKTGFETTKSAYNAVDVVGKRAEAVAAKNGLTDQQCINDAEFEIAIADQFVVVGNQKAVRGEVSRLVGDNNYNSGSTAMSSSVWNLAITYFLPAKYAYREADSHYSVVKSGRNEAIIHYDHAINIANNCQNPMES